MTRNELIRELERKGISYKILKSGKVNTKEFKGKTQYIFDKYGYLVQVKM